MREIIEAMLYPMRAAIGAVRRMAHRHRWEYGAEEEQLAVDRQGRRLGPHSLVGRAHSTVKVPVRTRHCPECGAKEKHRMSSWVPCSLTKEEEREKKLRELGI